MSSPKKVEEYQDFLETCLGGSVQDTEAYDKKVLGFKGDIFAVKEESEDSNGSNDEKEGKTKKEAECFALDDSDDDGSGLDDDDDEWELEDAYNFDPEKVAELLKKGGEINEEQLVETLQEGMAEAMLMRMNVFEDPEQEALRPDCQGEVDGRMTPPPRPADFEAQSPLEPKALAEKLDSTLSAGRRRSSIGGRRNLNEAVRTTTAKTRKSIACIASSKLASADDKAKIQQAADSTTKRHRMSLCKAAETLDIAGLGDEDEEVTKERLKMLTKCMLEARSRHRQSVARVVKETICGDEEDEKAEKAEKGVQDDATSSDAAPSKPKINSTLRACAKEFKPSATQLSIEQKIKQAVQAAHKRAGQVKAPEPSEKKQEWVMAYEQNTWHPGYDCYGCGYDQYGSGYGWDQQQMACGQMACGQMGCGQMAMGCGQMAYNQGCNWQQGWQGQQAGCAGGNWMMQDSYGNYGSYQQSYGQDYSNCYYNGYGQAQNAYGAQNTYGGTWPTAAWGSA